MQYQIAKEIAESHVIAKGMGHASGFKFEYNAIIKKEPSHEWALQMVKDKKAQAIGIYRDPRDVVVSLMKFKEAKGKKSLFDKISWLWHHAIEWWKEWEPLCEHVARYESVHPDGWYWEAIQISKVLVISITPSEAKLIAAKWSLERNVQRQQENRSWFDTHTMLVKSHISDTRGESTWRTVLAPDQVREIEAFVGADWMEAHGYSLLDS